MYSITVNASTGFTSDWVAAKLSVEDGWTDAGTISTTERLPPNSSVRIIWRERQYVQYLKKYVDGVNKGSVGVSVEVTGWDLMAVSNENFDIDDYN